MSTYKELLITAKDSLDALVNRFDLDEEKLLDKISKLEDTIEQMKESSSKPAWGSCRNGCEASYIDADGFCSPACAMGAPRGKFYTVAPLRAFS